MTQIDPNFFDPSVTGIPSVGPIGVTGQEPGQSESGVSSIEKSKHVVVSPAILPNFPILQMPTNDDSFSLAIHSLSSSDKSGTIEQFMMSQQLKLQDITNNILDSWNKNIQEIAEETRRIVNSPAYQAILEIQVHGNAGTISPISANPASINPTAANLSPEALLSTINRLQAFEGIGVSPSEKTSESSPDMVKTITIPFLSVMFAGGALVAGTMQLSATGMTTPVTGAMDIVQRLQPVLPQLMPDVLPMVNLLVMPLIYYTSWDHAIGSIRNKEGHNSQQLIQDFAKQIIKMVSNSDFIMANLVNKMNKAEQMSPQAKEQAAAMIKLILASLSLSLLYSQDVGKVQGQKFWGMEAQEFQGLLTGQIALPDPNRPKATSQDRLMATLLKLVKAQLDVLPPETKAQMMNILFDYLSDPRKLQDAMDPYKVFHDLLANSQFNPGLAGFERMPT